MRPSSSLAALSTAWSIGQVRLGSRYAAPQLGQRSIFASLPPSGASLELTHEFPGESIPRVIEQILSGAKGVRMRTSWMALGLVGIARWSTAAPPVDTMDDLEALAKQDAWSELVAHLQDIPPAKRNGR